MIVLRIIAYLLITFAIIDFVAGWFLGIDLTGVSWSPLVSGGLGTLLKIYSKGDD